MKMMYKKRSTFIWLGAFLTLIIACLFSACSNATLSTEKQILGAKATPEIVKMTPGATATTNGTTATTTGTTDTISFTGIRMLDQSNGWALTSSTILKTSDGGVHWKNVTPTNITLSPTAKGDFMSDTYAWVVNTSQNNTLSVLHTSDGGQTWGNTTIADANGVILDMPHFLNTQEGWLEIAPGGSGAGSEPVDIFHTIDGGQSWSKIASSEQSTSGLPRGGLKSGLSFKDAQNGWATGTDAATNRIWLYATHDGGKTWQPVTSASFSHLPDWGGTQNTTFFYRTTPPVFFGNNGFLPVQVDGQIDQHTQVRGLILYSTANGGQAWGAPAPGIDAVAKFMTNDLYIFDLQHAWASDENSGACYATIDSGKTWQNIGIVGQVSALSFVSPSNGWAIGGNILRHTSDGGKTWQQISYLLQ